MLNHKILCVVMLAFAVQGCADKNQVIYRHDFVVKHGLTEQPMPGVPYKITTPEGKVIKGKTDENGLTVEATSKIPGNFILTIIPRHEL